MSTYETVAVFAFILLSNCPFFNTSYFRIPEMQVIWTRSTQYAHLKLFPTYVQLSYCYHMTCYVNAMQANPDKFHFMLFSPTPSEQQALQLSDGTHLMSETEVTVLGVTIDDRLCFSQHISSCCKKAARQLNALAHISRHLNINSRRAIYNSFIMSNFNYCPLIWHFCGQVNNQKLEQIQERALRILFADYNSSYLELLKRARTTTLLIQRLRSIALAVFKSLHGLNLPFLNDMFTPKYVPYQMRDSSLLEQSRCRTTTYGLRSMSFYRF